MELSDLKWSMDGLKWKPMIEKWGEANCLVDKDDRIDFGYISLVDGKLTLKNESDPNPDNGETHGMFYDVNTVKDLEYDSETETVKIFVNSTPWMWAHKGQHIMENKETIDLRRESGYFSKTNNVAVIKDAIKAVFPEYKECIYWDVLNDRAVIDKKMFAGKDDDFKGDQIHGLAVYSGKESDIMGQFMTVFGRWKIRGKPTDKKLGEETEFVPDTGKLNMAINEIAKSNTRNPFVELIRQRPYDPEKHTA